MIEENQACCFSGHRIIATDHIPLLQDRLEEHIRRLIADGVTDFITGGARGFDTMAAETVLRLRQECPSIHLILALPCRDQTRGWSAKDRDRYEGIREQADRVHYTGQTYTPGCMMRRNRYMVDHSESCVFYLTNMRSGTYKTVAYAMERERTLYNILEPIFQEEG